MADNLHSTTRRTVLAGLATAPAGIALSAPAEAAGSDPIFSALAEYDRAFAAWEELTKASDEIEGQWFKVKHNFPNHVMLYGKIKIEKAEDVARHMTKDLSGFAPDEIAAIETIQTTTKNRLARALERRQAERDRLGIDKAEEAEQAAHSVLVDAEGAVLATAPTTKAGALAQMAFVRRQIESGAGWQDEILVAIASLEKFVERIGHHLAA